MNRLEKTLGRHSDRAYAFHITTDSCLNGILKANGLIARSRLTLTHDQNASMEMVTSRRMLATESGRAIENCVPFYLHPIQPMFVRLIALGRITTSQLVFMALPIQYCVQQRFGVFPLNPVYATHQNPLSLFLCSRGFNFLMTDWYLETSVHRRRELMLRRQAEISVEKYFIDLDDLTIVSGIEACSNTTIHSKWIEKVRSEYQSAVDSVRAWRRAPERSGSLRSRLV